MTYNGILYEGNPITGRASTEVKKMEIAPKTEPKKASEKQSITPEVSREMGNAIRDFTR